MDREQLEERLSCAGMERIYGIRLPPGTAGERRWIIVGKARPDPSDLYSPSALSEMPKYVELQERIHRLPFFVDPPPNFDQSSECTMSPPYCFADLEGVKAFLEKFDKSLVDVELLPEWWEPD